jgi:hypothetical protein
MDLEETGKNLSGHPARNACWMVFGVRFEKEDIFELNTLCQVR